MEQQYVTLIDTLYESAIDPESLNTFVKELSQLTNSAVGGIYARDANQQAPNGFFNSYGAPSQQLTEYERRSQFHSNYCRRLAQPPGPGSITYSQDILPGNRLHAECFYNTFLKPQGLEQVNRMFIEHDNKHSLTVDFMRGNNRGHFEKKDKAIFELVMPHLLRTFRLRKQTNDLKLHQSQVWEMMELLPCGVIVFSNHQKVMYVNDAAERMTFANDGIALHTTHLSAKLNAENKQLRHLLKTTIESALNPLLPMCGGDMLVSRGSGKRPYSVMVNPISTNANVGDIYPAAIVLVQDFEQDTQVPSTRLKALYELTPAESKVAHQMMLGNSLDQCAQNLGHTVSTSRNLLKRVFAKTNTSRQNELVSLLLRSPLDLVGKF